MPIVPEKKSVQPPAGTATKDTTGVVQDSTRGRRKPPRRKKVFRRISPTGNHSPRTPPAVYRIRHTACHCLSICSKHPPIHTARQFPTNSLKISRNNLVSGIKSCIFAVCGIHCFCLFIQERRLSDQSRCLRKTEKARHNTIGKRQQQTEKDKSANCHERNYLSRRERHPFVSLVEGYQQADYAGI